MQSERSAHRLQRTKRRRFNAAWFAAFSLSLAAVACPSGGQLQDSDRWVAEGCDAPKVVFETNCAGGFCHQVEDGEPPLGVLDLFSPGIAERILPGGAQATASYPDLQGEGCPTTPEPILDVNNVDNSLMMKKLKDEQTCGDRMPPAQLSDEDIECVRRWLVSLGTGSGTNVGTAGNGNAGGGGAL